MPLVTVYITNYNYGAYIEKAIQSVLDQTLTDFELIIIDDGSTDNSREVIEKYAHHSSISIIYQQNKGLNVTNNIAMRAASGKYLMRLDADDFLDETALTEMSSVLENDEELGLVFPNYYYVDSDGNKIGEEKRHDFSRDVKLMDQPAHGACTMIRLEHLKAVGGYNEAYNCQDGYELWVKFTDHYKVANVDKPLFYYRQHGNNLTGNEDRILSTRAKINEQYIKDRSFNTRSLAIIPIRGGNQDIAFKDLAGQNLLRQKISETLGANNIERVVVTSPDPNVKELLEPFDTSVIFHLRSKSEARYNQSLNPTIKEIVELQTEDGLQFEVIVVLTLEYPFLKAYKIDDIVNTMLVFGSDSIIGVRSDNSVFYQHHGDGLHPILNREKFTKLEREALFKQVGGISAVTRKSFSSSGMVINGQVGHVIMDQKMSIGLFTELDWEIAERLFE